MENLKDALLTVIETGETTVEALADGKISISEGVAITWKAIGFVKVVKNFEAIKEEYLNLDDTQKDELIAWFNNEFDIANDNAEEIVEMVFESLIKLGDIFSTVTVNK